MTSSPDTPKVSSALAACVLLYRALPLEGIRRADMSHLALRLAGCAGREVAAAGDEVGQAAAGAGARAHPSVMTEGDETKATCARLGGAVLGERPPGGAWRFKWSTWRCNSAAAPVVGLPGE